MKKATIVFLAIFAIAAAFAYLTGRDENHLEIYVSIDGDDQQSGTVEQPLKTLKQAALLARAGTTVYVREGTYEEKLTIKHSGSRSMPIVFKPYQNEQVILSGKGFKSVEDDTAMITIDNKNHVAISGFTVQDLSTDSADATVMGILVTGSSSHIRLDHNQVRRIETHSDQGNAHGIAVYGINAIKDIKLLNNKVEDLKLGTSEALVLNGNVEGFEISGNVVRRCNNIGIDLIGHEGISSNKKMDYARNGVVFQNEVYAISAYGNPAYGNEYSAAGIYVDGGRDINIEENLVYKNDIGIEATSEQQGQAAEHIKIHKNTVYENAYTGISIGGYDEERGGTRNSHIAKNILYRNDAKGIGGGQLMIQHDAQDNKIEKNILTAGANRIFIANYFKTGKNNKLIQNVFHKESGEKGIWIWEDEEFTSFTAFKSVSGTDKATRYTDPKYVNSSSFDFRFAEDSPIKGIFE